MVKKKTVEQKRHDEGVHNLAEELKADKWDVKANAEGAKKPSNVGTFTPDIEATKGGLRRICEVVTEKDFRDNKAEYIDFKHYCEEYDFHFYVVDKDGKRREVDPRTLGEKNK